MFWLQCSGTGNAAIAAAAADIAVEIGEEKKEGKKRRAVKSLENFQRIRLLELVAYQSRLWTGR